MSQATEQGSCDQAMSDSVASPSQYTPTSDELSLERGIHVAAEAVLKAGTPEAQRIAYQSLQELHARRSPAMIAHLERQRGLAR